MKLNDNEKIEAVNVELVQGKVRKRVTWKTFKGMVYQLKLINNRALKYGWSSDFTIRLPIKKG